MSLAFENNDTLFRPDFFTRIAEQRTGMNDLPLVSHLRRQSSTENHRNYKQDIPYPDNLLDYYASSEIIIANNAETIGSDLAQKEAALYFVR